MENEGGYVMLGTIVNALAIIVGSIVGSLVRNGLKEKYKNIIMQAIPLAVLFIGASGSIQGIIDPNSEPVLFIISLVIGGILGEWIGIESKLESMGNLIQKRFGAKDSNIAKGFVSASIIFCVGTMAILGALQSGLEGKHDMLFAKSILDGITSVILASSLGIGVIFSAAAVFIYQGLITIFAGEIESYMTEDMIREISIVGGILIFSIGLSMLEIKKIKTGNLLPAIFIPVVYYIVIIPLIGLLK